MYKEILVYTSTENSIDALSEFASSFASRFSARMAVLLVEPDDVDLSKLEDAITEAERASAVEFIFQERARVRQSASDGGALFEAKARAADVPCDIFHERCAAAEISALASRRARLFDAVLLPAAEQIAGFKVRVAEEMLFGSGRPSILVPSGHDICSFDQVVIAWDGGVPATRAVHDALPILRIATSVDVIAITEEKPLDRHLSGADLARHLASHGVAARHHDVPFTGKSVGVQLIEAALGRRAGLLIMGAYGHHRLKQMVFGGATRSVLEQVVLPVLLSH
jgi:nucleotide-binding universal stress UspA family protein